MYNIDYNRFIEMAKNNELKVTDIDHHKLISDVNTVNKKYPDITKKANAYVLSDLINLFDDMCEEYQTLIDVETYLKRYMEVVHTGLVDNPFTTGLNEDELKVYEVVLKIRGYSAYRSKLAEISFALLCEHYYDNEYEVVFNNNKMDIILGVDITLLHKHSDMAHYIHVTRDSKFSKDQMFKKAKSYNTVVDNRYDNEGPNKTIYRQFRRNFDNHITALYNEYSDNNDVVNGIFLFKKEYIDDLIEANVNKANRNYYDELSYVELADVQIRTTYDKVIIK